MQNHNAKSRWLKNQKTSKALLTVLALFVFQFYANGQTKFTLSTFNSTYVPISIVGGATSSIATGDNADETGIPIGFNFGYADSTFSVVGLNTNGLVWFDPVAPTGAASYNSLYMVTTSGANQCLAPWFTNLFDDASSDILYQTQGTPGSQTFTIQYSNYPTATGVPGSNVRMNFQIVLYEGSNVIEFKYGSLNITGGQTTSSGAMIALEWGGGGSGKFIDAVTGSSIVNNRLLSPFSGWPSYNFRFTPGIPAPIPAGTYNVGIGQTYNSLTRAIADANHRGLDGVVTFNLTDAQYDTTVANGSNIFPLFVATPNGSLTNRLTISKIGTPATIAYRGSSVSFSGAGSGTGVNTTAFNVNQEPIIGVCASYTTISNVNLITHGSPQTVNVGLAQTELFGNKGAQNNFYDKISVDLDRNHGGVYGIASWSTTSPGGFAGTNSNNTWRDLNIKDCNVGISLSAPNNATGPADQGNQIITSSCNIFNYIGDPNTPDDIIGGGASGVSIGGQFNCTVRNCIIQNITGTSTIGDVDGIVIGNSYGILEISNNIIHTLRRSNAALNSGHWVSGIRINWDNQTMNFKIFNNSISNLLSSYSGVPTSLAAIVGIYFQDTGAGNVSCEIFNNSISLNGSTFPNASSVCFSNASVSKYFEIKNNVFANFTSAQSGAAYHACIYTNAASQYGNASSLSDYNNFYLADTTNGYIGQATSTKYQTLAAWSAAMTLNPGTDVNSVVSNPFFVNNDTDLHATALSVALNGTATTPPAYLTTDIDCQTRTAPHDIGFDDFGVCTPIGGTITPAIANICDGGTYNMAATGFSTEPGTTYQWQVSATPGGPYSNVTGGTGATTTSYTTGALATGTYYFVMQTSCSGPGTDLSSELQLIVNAAPTTAAAGPDQGVVSASATLAGNSPSVGTGQWSVIAGSGVFVNDADPGTVVNGLSAGVNTFRWTISGTFCPSSTDDVDIIFSNCVNPVATISGDAEICAGGSTNLTLNFTGLAPFTYAINGGTPVTTSSNPETLSVNPASTTVYTITSFSDALCTGLFSGSATVTVTNAPPATSCTITSYPIEGCVGNVVVVSTTVVSDATSYTWTAPSGTLINGSPSPVTTLTNSASITLGPVASGSSGWQICAFASNACGQTNTNCKFIRGVLSTPSPIVGSAIACPNTGPDNYSTSAVAGASSYLWTITGDATVSGTGTNASVSFGPGFTSGTLCVSALLACGYQSGQRCMSISNSTPSLSAMSGTFTVCPGTNGVAYSVSPSVGAASYNWTLPSGASIASGVNTNSITVDFGPGFSIGNICVTAVSVCGTNSLQRCKSVASITPGVPGNISGASTGVCGQTITYSIPSVSGATSYTWVAPAGATLGSPNGTNTMSIIYPSNFTTGSLCVTATNACGTGSPRCINVKGVSANPGVVSGPVIVCANDLADVYSVSPVFGATGYQWTTPSGSIIVSGQGTNSIIVDWGTSGGVIGVTATGTCGNSGTRTLNVTMNCRISGNVSEEMNILAYPNPANDILNLNIKSESNDDYMVELIDVSGRVVYSTKLNIIEGTNANAIDVSGIAKGMYQLTLVNSNGVSTHIQVAVQ